MAELAMTPQPRRRKAAGPHDVPFDSDDGGAAILPKEAAGGGQIPHDYHVVEGKIDAKRKFVIAYFLSDDTILVTLVPELNSGIFSHKQCD